MAATNAQNYPFLYNESVSAVTSTNSVSLGAQRIENGKWYTYAYNAAPGTASVSYGVIASANSGYSFATNSVLGDFCAGVVVHNDIKTAQYGWVQTKGPAIIQMTTAGVSKDTTLGGGVALGDSGMFTGVTAVAGTAATGSTAFGGRCGTATTAIVAGSSGVVWLNNTTWQ
jgi:hypothetical protein